MVDDSRGGEGFCPGDIMIQQGKTVCAVAVGPRESGRKETAKGSGPDQDNVHAYAPAYLMIWASSIIAA